MTGCIEWKWAKSSAGYGQKRIDGKLVYMHRLAYADAHGPIPDGMLVRHKCDNPACFNVNHLELGTQRDNMQDASKRGRINKTKMARGEDQGLSVLTEDLVREIRKSTVGCTTLAREMGVSKSTVLRVRQGKTWRHVDG